MRWGNGGRGGGGQSVHEHNDCCLGAVVAQQDQWVQWAGWGKNPCLDTTRTQVGLECVLRGPLTVVAQQRAVGRTASGCVGCTCPDLGGPCK